MLALVGCPKSPAPPGSGAGTGAPASGGSASGSAGGGAGTGVGGPDTTIPALPAPRDFAEAPALRDVLFDFDQAVIRIADADALRRDAEWLKANPSTLLLVEGHADERGTNEYNLALGERRAKTSWLRSASTGRGSLWRAPARSARYAPRPRRPAGPRIVARTSS